MFKCFICITILAIISSTFFGMALGYKLGVSAVCDDVNFYYNGDFKIRPCIGDRS